MSQYTVLFFPPLLVSLSPNNLLDSCWHLKLARLSLIGRMSTCRQGSEESGLGQTWKKQREICFKKSFVMHPNLSVWEINHVMSTLSSWLMTLYHQSITSGKLHQELSQIALGYCNNTLNFKSLPFTSLNHTALFWHDDTHFTQKRRLTPMGSPGWPSERAVRRVCMGPLYMYNKTQRDDALTNARMDTDCQLGP